MLGVTTEQEQAIRRAAGDLQSELDRSERNLFTMQLMQIESLIDRNPAQAIVMLDDPQRCPPRLRDLAWGLFRRRATQDQQTLRGHEAAVLAATATLDGQQIVSVGADRTVRWFDTASGSTVRTMTFEVDAIGAVALAHDGSQLAVGDGRGVVRVWSLKEAAGDVKAFEPLSSEVVVLAWSIDHQRLAAAGGDGEIRCWKIGGTSWTEPAGDLTSVLTLTFSNDGERLASGGADGAVRLWNAADGTPLDSFSGHAGGARAIAFSADDQSLAVASQWEPAHRLVEYRLAATYVVRNAWPAGASHRDYAGWIAAGDRAGRSILASLCIARRRTIDRISRTYRAHPPTDDRQHRHDGCDRRR